MQVPSGKPINSLRDIYVNALFYNQVWLQQIMKGGARASSSKPSLSMLLVDYMTRCKIL